MENRYINRYRSFCKSLDILEQSCGADPEAKFVLGATAQAFNLTFDLSWKVMKDILVKYFAIQNFATGSPRETLRTAYGGDLLLTITAENVCRGAHCAPGRCAARLGKAGRALRAPTRTRDHAPT